MRNFAFATVDTLGVVGVDLLFDTPCTSLTSENLSYFCENQDFDLLPVFAWGLMLTRVARSFRRRISLPINLVLSQELVIDSFKCFAALPNMTEATGVLVMKGCNVTEGVTLNIAVRSRS